MRTCVAAPLECRPFRMPSIIQCPPPHWWYARPTGTRLVLLSRVLPWPTVMCTAAAELLSRGGRSCNFIHKQRRLAAGGNGASREDATTIVSRAARSVTIAVDRHVWTFYQEKLLLPRLVPPLEKDHQFRTPVFLHRSLHANFDMGWAAFCCPMFGPSSRASVPR
ncbi:hypothetical protein HPB50_021734 [Hyalomma asiaticum]|uniref:Uncharacterized protein n=1 Tax=Hyalomma asiaticum TaxID=266040 RepID=A0ACB7TR48_HYAAI|nr:hypothetical protein HPB50_021734 [Hyalomma asiaticum]